MTEKKTHFTILFAEDDDDDFMLARDALRESHILNGIYRVTNGEELLDFLRHRGAYTNPLTAPRPGIILLDLNMPRMDGREALTIIKGDPSLRRIPVVVLTTSRVETDILQSYDLGVSSFIQKPVTFEQLCQVIRVFKQYWFEIVELPADG